MIIQKEGFEIQLKFVLEIKTTRRYQGCGSNALLSGSVCLSHPGIWDPLGEARATGREPWNGQPPLESDPGFCGARPLDAADAPPQRWWGLIGPASCTDQLAQHSRQQSSIFTSTCGEPDEPLSSSSLTLSTLNCLLHRNQPTNSHRTAPDLPSRTDFPKDIAAATRLASYQAAFNVPYRAPLLPLDSYY